MSNDRITKKGEVLAIKQAEKLAEIVCKEIIKDNIYENVKVEQDGLRTNVLYEKNNTKHRLVYINVESIEKITGPIVDIGFDIGYYEDGKEKRIVKCLERAIAEYTKRVEDGEKAGN